jgi:hypothetical protein
MSLPYPDVGIKPVSTHNFGEDKVTKGRIQGKMIAGNVQVISGIINTSINLILSHLLPMPVYIIPHSDILPRCPIMVSHKGEFKAGTV